MSPAWILVVGFIFMGIDKVKARRKSWRIPEKTLFTLALAGGAFGIVVGSGVFHHKTSKGSFMGVVLLIAVVWVLVIVGLQSLLQ